jgi:hypothetical protein
MARENAHYPKRVNGTLPRKQARKSFSYVSVTDKNNAQA